MTNVIKELSPLEGGKFTTMENVLIALSIISIIICPVFVFLCFKVINQNERAVILRLGRITKHSPLQPGLTFFIPCTDVVVLLDIRLQSMEIEPQEILTYDAVSITVVSTIFFSIKIPVYTTVNTRHYKHAVDIMARTVIANTLGQYTVPTLLSNRDILGVQLQRDMCKVNLDWGLDVEKFVIKELILPYEMQHSMQAEAEGIRLAKAKIVESEGEIRSAEVLNEASKIFLSYPNAMKLRYLQTLNAIGANKRSTIVFPFPITIFHDCNLTAEEIQKYGVDKVDCSAWLQKERCEQVVKENAVRMKKMQEDLARSRAESVLVRARKDERSRINDMIPLCAATKCPAPC